MYNRYIPPPKGGKPAAPKPGPAAPSPATGALPAVIPPTSTTPYARYVPPARAAPTAAPTSFNASATSTPAPRAPPPSKTHLNAAAIPPPESLAPKIVFDYDEDDPLPLNKRKSETPEPTGEPKAKKIKNDKKDRKDKKERAVDVKPKKSKKREEKEEDATAEDQEDASRHESAKKQKETPGKEKFAFGFDESIIEAEEIATAEVHTTTKKKKKDKAEKTEELGTGPDVANSASKDTGKKEDRDGVSRHHKGILERAAKALKEGQKPKVKTVDEVKEEDGAEPVEAHGLEPLPQPEPVVQDASKPTYETLPAWIANPVRVTPETTASFTDLGLSTKHGISKEVSAKLKLKGYEKAFAVQTAVIPLLLPSPDRQGDVVVSAATGSGKTLSYVLPMVRDISQAVITRLRGVIVVPTRELVLQAKEVCDICASAFSGPGKKTVKIGISMGNKQFKQEQADLVAEDQRWDPEGHQKWLEEHFSRDMEFSLFDDDTPKPLPHHVVDYVSKVDILICTPGRLVDHINRTPGFTLDYVRWLVVDEADKLLAQTFQEWLPVVMPLLSVSNIPEARAFADSNKTGVRKVVLSATMTRELSLLNGLKLSRPTLITLEGSREQDEKAQDGKTEHVLPELLEESAIKVRDPDLKSLYLVDLLDSSHISSMDSADSDVEMKDGDDEEDTKSSDESDSDSDSSDSDTSDDDSNSESKDSNGGSTTSPKKAKPFTATVLIFTRSNEIAIRLSRLLALLSPHLKSLIGTLTSTTRTSQRRKTLHAFASRKLRILVASDLVARGIDLANLDHVVNYDMPTSVASYVHRVGRTARAGRSGKAWTLFTKAEAGWFWTAVAGKGESKSRGAAGAGHIKRKGKVEEIRIEDRWDEERVAGFQGALEKLGKEASDMRKKKSR
ncbi:unnamed protein product [Discula destructiva]